MAAADHDAFLFPAAAPYRKPFRERLRAGLTLTEGQRAELRELARKEAAKENWPALWSMAMLVPTLALRLTAMDLFEGSAWEASPRTGLALIALAWLPCACALWLGWRQWRVRARYKRPWLAGGAALAVGALWAMYLPYHAYGAWRWGSFGVELLHQADEQRLRPGIEVTPDGTGIIMRMGFHYGVAGQVKGLLRGRPEIRRIELSGPGGIADEAMTLARLVRERGLDTRVQRFCASACALVFAAGRRRELLSSPGDGLVDFHQSSTESEGRRVRADRPGLYEETRIAGATDAFIWRVAETPFRDLWQPSPSEFAAGGLPVVTLGPYDTQGDLWGARSLSRREATRRLDPRGEIAGVMAQRDPDVLADALRWASSSRKAARNERMVGDRMDEAVGRVLALRLSRAPDAEVLRAGRYVRAAMDVVRNRSLGWCARLGDRPNLLVASRELPGPPGAASDPDAPYGSLLERAYGMNRYQGWPEGIGLPDPEDAATWADKAPPPRPSETCGELLAWYAEATDIGNPSGAGALRARFAAFARTPVLTGAGEGPSAAPSASLSR